jgi:hypothetical protein
LPDALRVVCFRAAGLRRVALRGAACLREGFFFRDAFFLRATFRRVVLREPDFFLALLRL